MPASPSAAAASIGRGRLTRDFRALGLRRGQDLLVHCSMRTIGWIDGGPATLLGALQEAAGPAATIVVPAMTTVNSFSSSAFLTETRGLTGEEYERYIAAMPGFDPAVSPSAGMGALAEHVRTRPGACRSGHPLVSFAALGPGAAAATAVHDLTCHLGERSPLAWLYRADAAIMLLGVGYSSCTAFHLAEYRVPGRQRSRRYRCLVAADGSRELREFTGIELDDSDFPALGQALESTQFVRRGLVGAAQCKLVPMRAAVDFACSWLMKHRTWRRLRPSHHDCLSTQAPRSLA